MPAFGCIACLWGPLKPFYRVRVNVPSRAYITYIIQMMQTRQYLLLPVFLANVKVIVDTELEVVFTSSGSLACAQRGYSLYPLASPSCPPIKAVSGGVNTPTKAAPPARHKANMPANQIWGTGLKTVSFGQQWSCLEVSSWTSWGSVFHMSAQIFRWSVGMSTLSPGSALLVPVSAQLKHGLAREPSSG